MFKSNGFLFSPAASTLPFSEWEGNCRNSESEGVDGRQSQVGPAFAKLVSPPLGAKHTHSLSIHSIFKLENYLSVAGASSTQGGHGRPGPALPRRVYDDGLPWRCFVAPAPRVPPDPPLKMDIVTVAGCISPLSPSHTELPQIFNLGLGIAT